MGILVPKSLNSLNYERRLPKDKNGQTKSTLVSIIDIDTQLDVAFFFKLFFNSLSLPLGRVWRFRSIRDVTGNSAGCKSLDTFERLDGRVCQKIQRLMRDDK